MYPRTESLGGKTLLITSVFPPQKGGSGRWFWEIYCRQPRDHVVVAAGQTPHQEEFDREHDLQIVRVPLSFPTWGIGSITGLRHYARAYRIIQRIVRAEGISNIHCGTLLPEGWLGWLCHQRSGLPYLCYVHGEELNIGKGSRELGWLMKRVLARTERIIANSENTVRILQAEWHVPPQRISRLHPGTNTERFRPVMPDPDRRSHLGWADRCVVLTTGRLQRRKGHDQLIRAIGTIRKAVPNVLYSIVGEGDQRSCLEQLVKENGLDSYIQFRGEVQDAELLHCYQQCDLFVLPNREVDGDIEGFGMVLVEAQACGKPVVAGRSGGTAETMRVGVTGELVQGESLTELTQVITNLLTDESRRHQMGREARDWAVAHFDWKALAQRAQDLFCRFDATSKTLSVTSHPIPVD